MKRQWGGARPGSGRKPRPPEEHRRNRLALTLNLTDAELDALTKAAKGGALAAFARKVLQRYLARRR